MATRRARWPALLGVLAILSVPAFFVGQMALFALSPMEMGSKQTAIVEVHKAEGHSELARELAAKGVITNSRLFYWLGRITREWKRVKTGEYEVSRGMSPIEIFGVLTSGISVRHPVTVREGENMYEIAADLEAKALAKKIDIIRLCRDFQFMVTSGLIHEGEAAPPSLEGYLFPDTYFFNKTMSPEDMLRQMVHHFLGIWTQAEADRARILGLTRHETITLASMIEKETGAGADRPVISSVMHNRLKKKMRLQSDPTTIYGMWEHYNGNIHRSDLLAPSPYNTYTVAALPIGPIANPGREAIHAALYPIESEYLYFVSHNDGTTQFSKTLGEHNSAVQKFQVDPTARQGKSWRDLGKKR